MKKIILFLTLSIQYTYGQNKVEKDSTKNSQLEEVIVTANKVEQKNVEVPVSVTSISAKAIADSRLISYSDLTARVPNYLYQGSGVGFQSIHSIRGIQVFSYNPAVSTYVDDVNSFDIMAGGFELTDIDRIEILRGPQSTLFGRNAMGGVVNVYTKKPTNKTTGFIELESGNFALQRYSAGIKTPFIKDKLFFGLNGLFLKKDGFMKNDITGTPSTDTSLNGKTIGDEENTYGNIFLKWLVNHKLSFTANVKHQRDFSNASGYLVSQKSEKIALETPTVINLARIGTHERKMTNYSLTVKYQAQNFELTSISAFQQIYFLFKNMDFPGYYESFYRSSIGEKLPTQNVWSQEVRINSSNKNNKFQYIAGLYGFKQISYDPTSNLAYELAPNKYVIYRNKRNNSGYAAFGEISYKFLDKLKVVAGARYDIEERESVFNGFGDAVFVGGVFTQIKPDVTKSVSYSSFSPKASLIYNLDKKSNVYATFTRGFRAGGISSQIVPAGVRQDYDPEYSDNFELGYKTNFWDNRVNLNVAAFMINWQDLQFSNLVAPATYSMENVGDAYSKGIELEANIIPVKGLQLDFAYAINDAEYKDFDLKRIDFASGSVIVTPIGGNKLSNAPKTTFYTAAQYSIETSEKVNLLFRVEFRNIGGYYTDIQNSLYQPTYHVVNTRFGLSYKNYGLFLWTKNLTNEHYLLYGSSDTSLRRSSVAAMPSQIGMTLSFRF
ncbi:TonB-dependent receptor [Flavobacterium sp. ANB]|uniref:TonB-dependent receptor n=1 Tax=unclassified Flavobacterium TaxID=196869 RepID=UPI0012B96293|nr:MULTISPECIES: TonB-dependent receptor [unclassified Flavobacterium]MBF4518757.1 TonB-dependent receptor [Flavobacterium sp. ANB]MTD71530.1 TonB-dependent receptor [Flavobacterium sp. LC2016-13]